MSGSVEDTVVDLMSLILYCECIGVNSTYKETNRISVNSEQVMSVVSLPTTW